MSDQPAMRADSQPPHNAASNPPVPPLSQGEREYLECIAALRQRVVAAGRVA